MDAYLHLQRCRERFEAGEAASGVLADMPHDSYTNAWLESRRGQLLLQLARQLEREGNLPAALRLHAGNRHPGARERAIRVLERCGQPEAALELALVAAAAPRATKRPSSWSASCCACAAPSDRHQRSAGRPRRSSTLIYSCPGRSLPSNRRCASN
ncbi:hypothetical protein GCM10027514_33480 [Azotobacter armeniacus]